jgi:predicted metal-dependent hydrolase
MATIFSALTLFILSVSAFVAYKNNERMKFEIEEKNTALTNLKINQDELKLRQGILEALRVEIPKIQEDTKLALEEGAKLQDINKKLKSDLESKTRKIASNGREYDETKNTLLLVGEPTELVSKAKDKRIESQELDVLISNKESNLANLNAKNTAAEDLGRRLKENLDIISRGDSLPTMKTKIRNIYSNWGFVTLANGYQSGVTGGSSLDIVRDDKVIGKLLVSTVEKSSASASIVPDSIAEDITLRVGDQVVATLER